MLKASSINPRCEIVLYANSLFILNCVSPKTLPIIRDKKELKVNPLIQLKLKAE